MGLSSLNFFYGGLRKTVLFLQEWRFVGTNRKRVCDFLLVSHRNFGPLHRFRDTAGFLCSWPHPYSILILGVFPLHQIAVVGVDPSRYLKALSGDYSHQCGQGLSYPAMKIYSEYSKLCKKRYLNVTDRRTDRQTTQCGITALYIALRGKNYSSSLAVDKLIE